MLAADTKIYLADQQIIVKLWRGNAFPQIIHQSQINRNT